MKLKSKLLGGLILVAIAYIALNVGLCRFYLYSEFEELENAAARRNIERCARTIEREIHLLDRLCIDWAAWDDTYKFIQDQNPQYQASNLVSTSFTDNRLHLMCFVDTKGDIVWQQVWDLDSDPPRQEDPAKVCPSGCGEPKGCFYRQFPKAKARGIVMSRRGPMMLCSQPILTSDNKGPSRGTLIFGRYLDEDLIGKLREQIHVEFDVLPAGNIPEATDRRPAEAILAGEESLVLLPLHSKEMRAYIALHDTHGKPIIVLRGRIPRDLTQKGTTMMFFAVMSIVAITVILTAILYFLLQRLVVGPVLRLTRYAEKISPDSDGKTPDIPAGLDRNDEIGILAAKWHDLLSRLQFDITQRKDAEEALREYQKQLQDMASELGIVEEKQRRSISAELHDRIGQTLVAAKLKLGVLRTGLQTPENIAMTDALVGLIDQTTRDVWSLTFELCPPILYDVGLKAALEWLAKQFSERHGIKFTIEDGCELVALPDEIRGFLFQAVRELLNNVIKHAQANDVRIIFAQDNDELRITVGDNGVGFDRTAVKAKAGKSCGFGLFSIRERLRYFGGELQLDSQPQNGAKVTITVPVPQTEEAVEDI
ncbi:MAG: ATP-binding protein [Phycisphaerae bacterium]|nr:ATP-binding protein [Phycisphaerae bacterium]